MNRTIGRNDIKTKRSQTVLTKIFGQNARIRRQLTEKYRYLPKTTAMAPKNMIPFMMMASQKSDCIYIVNLKEGLIYAYQTMEYKPLFLGCASTAQPHKPLILSCCVVLLLCVIIMSNHLLFYLVTGHVKAIQYVIRNQLSGISHAVVRKLSDSHQTVIKQTPGSHQAVVRQSLGRCHIVKRL